MKTILYILILTSLVSCTATKTSEQYIVLQYEDFGPQAMAHSVIGMQWWQWLDYGSANPKAKYDIKVIVHPDTLTNQLKNEYLIDQEKNLDYRFVTLGEAQKYLNTHIEENLMPEITKKLKETRQKIDNAIENKS